MSSPVRLALSPPDMAGISSEALGRHSSKRVATAANEFESVLLGQFLQSAEASFGAAPGGNSDDSDSGEDEQMQSFATQHLAEALAAHGGIGIGRLVEQGLRAASERSASTAYFEPDADRKPGALRAQSLANSMASPLRRDR